MRRHVHTRTNSPAARWSRIDPSRGVALFFALFSLVNAMVAGVARRSEDVWWIDYAVRPSWLGALVGLVVAVLLFHYAVEPHMSGRRRFLSVAAAIVLSTAAVNNALGFYVAWSARVIQPRVPIPFSAVLAVVFVWLAKAMWRSERRESRAGAGGVIAAAVAVAMLFPLFQVWFFGTTDYRRPAQVAVVFGARVHADGSLSSSAADRVRTAVDLYRDGMVPRLVMSGAVGESGVDEAAAMRDFAVGMGVPREAIALDSSGFNTDASVRNTVAQVDEGERLLVVSHFYHLPRIKLAYRAAGRNVFTVPAHEQRFIGKTPLFVMREIPGFWVYWSRAVLRDLAR